MCFLSVLLLTAAIGVLLLSMTTTIAALNISADERRELSTDLTLWQKKFGNDDHVRTVTASANVTHNALLGRLKAAKDKLPALRAANPYATFSHLTKFALLTDKEFAQFASEASPGVLPSPGHLASAARLNRSAPVGGVIVDTVDWTTPPSCVPPVQYKGKCASNWAIAAAAAVSTTHCLATSEIINLSAQLTTSCAYPGGPDGCQGAGIAQDAMRWLVSQSKSLCAESAIPYTSGGTGSAPFCSDNTKCAGTISLRAGPIMTMNGEDALARQLQLQPVVAYVTTLNNVWKMYTGGIVSWCPPTVYVDQAMLVVGYGTEAVDDGTKSVGFFKVRNAWGTDWGERGHIRLQRGLNRETGTCKLAMYLAYSVLPSSRRSDATAGAIPHTPTMTTRGERAPTTQPTIDVEGA
ncbi:hypothetical protein SDRG_12740 [Saprolegnia diclina VS20]|uniref:Peptidase C1A papain C-terminal domain-containing protein n=1 Tax=Saprolegnia diclina (strain VS20) TaxID=1156394 RepID=T0RI71_SAPDV|nr:hypothetical protein SDRG_12740 [Saprolegnia diclina VS20]EQC29492.1 hypothetical protein SDRG_12740 [Saprolegnia diclina VS20]|eukprot:XP_008617044.1 hypothetical protein SDRG_12740 [Saprolegnia diclina VS20]